MDDVGSGKAHAAVSRQAFGVPSAWCGEEHRTIGGSINWRRYRNGSQHIRYPTGDSRSRVDEQDGPWSGIQKLVEEQRIMRATENHHIGELATPPPEYRRDLGLELLSVGRLTLEFGFGDLGKPFGAMQEHPAMVGVSID